MEITPAELKNLLAENSTIQLIDIREDYQFEDFNIGGINIPLDKIIANRDKIDTSKKVIFICNTGRKSAAVIHTLKVKYHINNLYNVKGGMESYAEECF
ncbi:MAG: rhodanese-like domain-containing protein [Vicingaceae bacterium]|nr:rhodanese-like domain-containing protein [Vicingaceae bacterium]